MDSYEAEPNSFMSTVDPALLQTVEYSEAWACLQFRSQTTLSLSADNVPADIQWMDGSFKPKKDYMGESGGCLYIVQKSQLVEEDVWQITIHQFASTRFQDRKSDSWTFLLSYLPENVALDPERQVAVFARSINGSTGKIDICAFATGELMLPTYEWDATEEYESIIAQLEIKHELVAIHLRQGVIRKSASGIPGPSQMLFYNFNLRTLLHLPVDGSLVWGFQFVDQHKILILERSKRPIKDRESRMPRLRLLSMQFVPKFKIVGDSTSPYTIEVPQLVDQAIDRVYLIPNISAATIEEAIQCAPVYDVPEDRLIGLLYQYRKSGIEKHELVVLVNLQELLKSRVPNFMHMDASYVTGHEFKLCGRRLIWRSGDILSSVIHIQDFNPNATALYLGPSGYSEFRSVHDQSWITTAISKENRTTPENKSMYTKTNVRAGIKRLFPTQDNLVMIIDGIYMGAAAHPLMVWACNIELSKPVERPIAMFDDICYEDILGFQGDYSPPVSYNY
ncbi:hypothetical protein BDQ12DRAFT_720460 [Crucibulum laeve]|uniref:Uncharacterized protein n=1 Tax=Crucibulum laeve TaxID=68775 RepID=A0A5C3MKE5_9AGAR|nr:hypothetical protein BDQ12DRAFT_720460 [Crucibulum laeve]